MTTRGKRAPRRSPPTARPGDAVAANLLAGVLELAQHEGALEGEALRAFAGGLSERAAKILGERVARLDERLGLLDTENTWRRDAVATLEESARSLEKESAWRKETIANLETAVQSLEEELSWKRETVRALEGELAWRRDAMASLETEVTWRREAMAALQGEAASHKGATDALEERARSLGADASSAHAELVKASEAHDALLAHHRQLLARVAGELAAVASLSLLGTFDARRRLRRLIEQLRTDTL
jgi:chromosome segregation ATPase